MQQEPEKKEDEVVIDDEAPVEKPVVAEPEDKPAEPREPNA